MKNRILAMVLAAMLCLGIIAGFIPSAVAFSDVSGETLTEAVEVLSTLKIIDGYTDGTYRPGDSLTRAAFCKLAVLAEGHGDQVNNSAYKTLFSDVPGSSWAAPYVNLAYEEKLISGYGNGRFGPDDAVTTSQAVTILLKLLGYTTADIGPFWPEDYMARAKTLGLLSGVSKTADQALTRGDAAILLYNLLTMDTTQGKDFYLGLCASTQENVLLLDADATADDGTLHTAKVYGNGAVTYFSQSATLSASFAGRRGTLLFDKSGKVSGFLPDEVVAKELTVSSIDGSAITPDSGSSIAVSNSTPVLMDDEMQNYQDCWYDILNGDDLTVFYAEAGSIDLIWVHEKAAGSAVTVTGYYEDASPNTSAPSTITVLGASLPVSDEGRAALKGFSLGDKLTVTLDRSGEVAGAVAAASGTAYQYGVLKSADANKVTVELTAGVTATGKPYATISSSLVGSLVKVTSPVSGKLAVSALSYAGSASALDVEGKTLGDKALADNVKLYDRVGSGSVTEVELGEILVASVPAASISFVGTNAAGAVDLLVLSDVTGNCYTYGILDKGEQSGGSGDMKYTNTTVSVENGSGAGTAYITGLTFTDGAVGGVAGGSDGKAAGIAVLTKVEGVTRADFDGSDTVKGITLSNDVQVYNVSTDKWITLTAAKAFTNSFTIYYDRTLSTGAQVRVIFAE